MNIDITTNTGKAMLAAFLAKTLTETLPTPFATVCLLGKREVKWAKSAMRELLLMRQPVFQTIHKEATDYITDVVIKRDGTAVDTSEVPAICHVAIAVLCMKYLHEIDDAIRQPSPASCSQWQASPEAIQAMDKALADLGKAKQLGGLDYPFGAN